MSGTTCTITKIENILLNGPYWRYGSHFETYTNLLFETIEFKMAGVSLKSPSE